jgi:hypothetical protein
VAIVRHQQPVPNGRRVIAVGESFSGAEFWQGGTSSTICLPKAEGKEHLLEFDQFYGCSYNYGYSGPDYQLWFHWGGMAAHGRRLRVARLRELRGGGDNRHGQAACEQRG